MKSESGFSLAMQWLASPFISSKVKSIEENTWDNNNIIGTGTQLALVLEQHRQIHAG